ncbi:MAG: carbamoyltransferase C-terminal domain-containing protein [Rhodocyclaceae bacterium]|nr:carbamoyltransferase C-terminal domain-containing protein [Rhodocyclaceae bacterium]MDZ4213954.1 carbamoyltransferase C-terminal domain-containing protein [Rhodocyclaceae bacterium]
MIVLGINYFFHDSSACLVVDGRIVAMLEEERFTRRKHTNEFPVQSIRGCLRLAGIAPGDIDHIAVSIQPTKDWLTKLAYGLGHVSQARPFVKHELWHAYLKQRTLQSWYRETYGNGNAGKARVQPPIHYVPHHAAHAAGSFLASPYDEAAILSLDGSGEWATAFMGVGRGVKVTRFQESYFPMSLGAFYEAATEFCGFKPNHDEGKTMGLAPFGDPTVFADEVRDLAWIEDDGKIKIDLSYFSYQFWGKMRCSERFHRVFGAPRHPDAPFADNHHNVAAAFQVRLEECALKLCRILRERTNARYLVLAGGVALNSVMNGRILRESGFDDIYVMPAAGDNGTAIGAALYVSHTLLGQARVAVHDDPYLGTAHDDRAVEALLQQCKLPYTRHADIAPVAAQLLADGNILGWLQGRMEIGPRALGNRSILANPAFPDMKGKINAEVKHREAYRPFAPSTPTESKDRFFDIKGDSPFMLKVCDVWSQMQSRIPAITHVDGSARLQTVDARINPLYHQLLTRFGEITDVPVLLNTSFNVQGEPIIESPEQAIRCFFSTGLDYLAMGSFLISKRAT